AHPGADRQCGRGHGPCHDRSGRQQILMLIARGATAGDIAAQLDISPLTARKHRENLMRKLDLHNTAEVVAYAARQGIPLD
ncbi:MAG: response regulator transcription factor, partial [Cupriavidus necator]